MTVLKETSNQYGSGSPEAGKVSVAHYYVDSDMNAAREEKSYRVFGNLTQAIEAYAELPNHLDKEIGMESTEEHPSRMTLIQCRNGIETLCDIEEESLSGKWVTEETIRAQNRAQYYLDNHDTDIAYVLKSAGRYFDISTSPEGYEYSFYDSTFHETNSGMLEDMDISIEEAVEKILSDEGLSAWPGHRNVMDYEELRRNVRETEREEIQNKISNRTEEQESLNGNSMAAVEELVLEYAQSCIDDIGWKDKVNLLGARVYGSRSREGLYTAQSDLDVALSYSGDISEDDFFNVLHDHVPPVIGIPLDINPISLEKTGTLEDYLQSAECFLDEKEMRMAVEKASKQTRPDFQQNRQLQKKSPKL